MIVSLDELVSHALCLKSPRIGSRFPVTLCRINATEIDENIYRWMDGCLDGNFSVFLKAYLLSSLFYVYMSTSFVYCLSLYLLQKTMPTSGQLAASCCAITDFRSLKLNWGCSQD